MEILLLLQKDIENTKVSQEIFDIALCYELDYL